MDIVTTGTKRPLSNVYDDADLPEEQQTKKARVGDGDPSKVEPVQNKQTHRRVYILDDGSFESMTIEDIVVITATTAKISKRVDDLLHSLVGVQYSWSDGSINWSSVLLSALDDSDPNADELIEKQDDCALLDVYAELKGMKISNDLSIARFDNITKSFTKGVACISVCFLATKEDNCHRLLEEWEDKMVAEEEDEEEDPSEMEEEEEEDV